MDTSYLSILRTTDFRCVFRYYYDVNANTENDCQNSKQGNVGHFGPDISATDVSATENAKGGCFGQIMNFGLGCVHA